QHPYNLQEDNPHRVQVTTPDGMTEYYHLTPWYADTGYGGLVGFSGISLGWLLDDAADDDFTMDFVYQPEGGAMGSVADSLGTANGETKLRVLAADFKDDTLSAVLGSYGKAAVLLENADQTPHAPTNLLYTASDGTIYEYGNPVAVTNSIL